MNATPITIVGLAHATLLISISARPDATEYVIVASGGTPAAIVSLGTPDAVEGRLTVR